MLSSVPNALRVLVEYLVEEGEAGVSELLQLTGNQSVAWPRPPVRRTSVAIASPPLVNADAPTPG